MGLDIDEFYVERIHRLGSLRRARAVSQTPRRTLSQISQCQVTYQKKYSALERA